MKNLLLVCFFFTTVTAHLTAQGYKTAVGGRLGYPLSASFKHFISENHALEAYVGTRGWGGYRWTNVSVAYLVHKPLEMQELEGLKWYFGGGGSSFFWNFRDAFLSEGYSTTTFGVQGYIGLEYTFKDAPINLTIDWAPTYFFNSYASGFGGGYGSVGVRYVLSR